MQRRNMHPQLSYLNSGENLHAQPRIKEAYRKENNSLKNYRNSQRPKGLTSVRYWK